MSAATRFTPGPWKVCIEPKNAAWHPWITIGAADEKDARRICDVTDWGLSFGDGFHGCDMTKANARLIAAAPDLLAALIEAEEYINRNPQAMANGMLDHDHNKYERYPLLDKLRDVIAKAGAAP